MQPSEELECRDVLPPEEDYPAIIACEGVWVPELSG
jgi:hypothetical protein